MRAIFVFVVVGMVFVGCDSPTTPNNNTVKIYPSHSVSYYWLGGVMDTLGDPSNSDTCWVNLLGIQNSMNWEPEILNLELRLIVSALDMNSVSFKVLNNACRLYKSTYQGNLKSITTLPIDTIATTEGYFRVGDIYFFKNADNYWMKFKIKKISFEQNTSLTKWRDAYMFYETYFYRTPYPDFSL